MVEDGEKVRFLTVLDTRLYGGKLVGRFKIGENYILEMEILNMIKMPKEEKKDDDDDEKPRRPKKIEDIDDDKSFNPRRILEKEADEEDEQEDE